MWPDLGLKGKLKSQKGRQRAVRAGKGTVFSHHGEGGSNYGRVNIRPRLDTVAQDMDVKSSLAVSRLPPASCPASSCFPPPQRVAANTQAVQPLLHT